MFKLSRVLSLLLSLLLLLQPVIACAEAEPDAWGYTDEDEDGLVLVTVPGETFTAYMLIVKNPSQVIVGCRPDRIGNKGYELSEFVQYYDGVAGINAGGFDDPNGMGDGSVPEHLIVHDGELICGYLGVGNGFAGIGSDGILRTDFTSVSEVEDAGILEGAGFGPVLVRNGEATQESKKDSGLNPRTAIGQRSDGAILLLVIDGRQVNSLGGNFTDEAELMLQFGAVTAVNMDGGSSSLMWYDNSYINNKSHSVGVRNMPSSFVVLKEGSGEEPTAAFLESFPTAQTTGEKTEERVFEEPKAVSADELTEVEERDEVSALALEFLQRYVDFSADVGHVCIINWNKLAPLVVKDSPLYDRLHSAFGSFGFAITNECEITEAEVVSCGRIDDSRYSVDLVYSTLATGRSYDTALEERSLHLELTRKNGSLYVDSMHFFQRSE